MRPLLPVLVLLAGAPVAALSLQSAANIPPEVRKILDETRACYQGLEALHIKTRSVVEPAASPQLLWLPPVEVELRYQKPNRIYLALARSVPVRGPRREYLVGDGKQVWRGPLETAKPSSSPSSLASFPELPREVLELDLLAGGDPFQALIESASNLSLAGEERIGDVPVDTVVAVLRHGSQPVESRARISIARSPRLVRRVVLEVTAPGADGKAINYRMETVYELVDAAPKFGPAHFAYPASAPSPAAKPPAKPAGSGQPGKSNPAKRP